MLVTLHDTGEKLQVKPIEQYSQSPILLYAYAEACLCLFQYRFSRYLHLAIDLYFYTKAAFPSMSVGMETFKELSVYIELMNPLHCMKCPPSIKNLLTLLETTVLASIQCASSLSVQCFTVHVTKFHAMQGLWPDARATLGYLHGKLCKWWRVLPLLLLCCPRLWPNCPCRHLRPWVPSHSRSSPLRTSAAPEEDQQEEGLPPLVDQVKNSSLVPFALTFAACRIVL